MKVLRPFAGIALSLMAMLGSVSSAEESPVSGDTGAVSPSTAEAPLRPAERAAIRSLLRLAPGVNLEYVAVDADGAAVLVAPESGNAATNGLMDVPHAIVSGSPGSRSVVVSSALSRAQEEEATFTALTSSTQSYRLGLKGELVASGAVLRTVGRLTNTAEAMNAYSTGSGSTTVGQVACWFAVYQPVYTPNQFYGPLINSQDYVTCDAPGGVVDTLQLYRLWYPFIGERVKYGALSASGYGWIQLHNWYQACKLTGGDLYWSYQKFSVMTPLASLSGTLQGPAASVPCIAP